MKKYYCIKCNKKICLTTWLYGSKMCRNCSAKERFKNPKNHPSWKGGKPMCMNCGKQLSRYDAIHCNNCKPKGKPQIIPDRYCILCGKKLYRYDNAIRCKKCSLLLQKGSNNPNWRGGISNFPYPNNFSKKLRESIRKRDNYECQNCGMTEKKHLKLHKEVLHIHHIDYNKNNNKTFNLITLCEQCNMKANSNRNYWANFYSKIIKRILKCD